MTDLIPPNQSTQKSSRYDLITPVRGVGLGHCQKIGYLWVTNFKLASSYVPKSWTHETVVGAILLLDACSRFLNDLCQKLIVGPYTDTSFELFSGLLNALRLDR
jgi:hypothetical protein